MIRTVALTLALSFAVAASTPAAPGRPRVPLPEVTQLYAGDAAVARLTAVAIAAEQVAFEVRRYGVSEDWLERRVRARLGPASVRQIGRPEALAADSAGLLVVRLQSTRIPGRETFAWHLSLGLHQRLHAVGQDAPVLLARTWEATASLGVTSGRALEASVGETLDQQVAEFLAARRGGGR